MARRQEVKKGENSNFLLAPVLPLRVRRPSGSVCKKKRFTGEKYMTKLRGFFFVTLGLPLGSDARRAARKIRERLEGSPRCGGEMLIWVVCSGSITRVAEALLQPTVLHCVQVMLALLLFVCKVCFLIHWHVCWCAPCFFHCHPC